MQCLQPLVAIRKDRGAKAELNRRGQACEILTGTGISRRVNGSPGEAAAKFGWACRYRADYFGLEDRHVSQHLCPEDLGSWRNLSPRRIEDFAGLVAHPALDRVSEDNLVIRHGLATTSGAVVRSSNPEGSNMFFDGMQNKLLRLH